MPQLVREAYHPFVVPVDACARPPVNVAWLRSRDVVFSVHEILEPEPGPLLGVCGWGEVSRFPGRIFLDQLTRPAPAPLRPQDTCDAALSRLEGERVWALPVEEDGRLQGVVTRSSLTEAGRRETHLEATPPRLHRLLRRLHTLESNALEVERITHDLANAFLGLSSYASVPPSQWPSPQVVSQLTHHAQALLERLRSLGEGTHSPERLEAAALLEHLAATLRLFLPEGVSLEVGAAAEAWVEVDLVDAERWTTNLVVNAIEALAGQPGVVTLTAEAETLGGPILDARGAPLPAGRYVVLCVADTGQGMSPGLLERAFDPFSTTHGEGRGIGLATVLRLVTRNGGGLRAHSQPGSGTRIEALLPVHAAV